MPAGSSSPMAGRCGATLRRKPGRFCTAYPLTGTTRCRLHGGKSLAGPAHGNWKHGMYSTVLPEALGTHYATARQNPALVALTEQIALVDAKVFELFEQVQRGESPAAWTRVLELAAAQEAALEAFATARRSANGPAMSQALRALTEAVTTLGTVARQGADPAPQGFLGHLIAREYSQEECRNGEARSRCGSGGGSPEGDRRCCRERPWGTVFGPAQARDGAASAARRGS